MRVPATFSFPTRVVFGAGALSGLPSIVAEWSPCRVLVVTDPGITAISLHTPVCDLLTAGGICWDLFDSVDTNPIEKNVDEGTAAFRDAACDFIIGLGGGSALDVAKAIRLRATHDLPLHEYDELVEGWKKTHGGVPPMLAIPTTAGTGSEVGRSAVITLVATGRKTVLFSPHLMPNVALLDPEMTVGLPPRLTAATGMDALTHSLESYLSINFHPFCDAVALHGLRLCGEYLPRAVENGADIEARGMMLLASSMGATAFQKGLGVAHSMAHPLSTLHGLHHGLANAIVLPTALRWNAGHASRKLSDVGKALSLELDRVPDRDAADVTIDWIENLSRRVGIPRSLSEAGVKDPDVETLARAAHADGCHWTNPRPVTADDLQFLYRQVL
ncbi:iron-containing alcohol dehydrogenase [Candidatus Poribacteria bacterium]|nr:iron-containing alcohol dehydrogenase [Candidatus Poribacteria bacterium]